MKCVLEAKHTQRHLWAETKPQTLEKWGRRVWRHHVKQTKGAQQLLGKDVVVFLTICVNWSQFVFRQIPHHPTLFGPKLHTFVGVVA